eukprot:maker-scaffold261_size233860-snap-gene-0.10 protein:Tk10677 transcript:maker-scaffold261_size233860-snap-gene-0.10-mRNA-1 annotation:"putative aminotransferase"
MSGTVILLLWTTSSLWGVWGEVVPKVCVSGFCLLQDYNKLEMPPGPNNVKIELTIMDIISIDDTEFSIAVYANIGVRWAEPRLHIKEVNGTDHVQVPVAIDSEFLRFDFYPLDAHICRLQISSNYNDRQIVFSDTILSMAERRNVVLEYSLEISKIPDEHRKIITKSMGNYSTTGIEFYLERY